MKSIRNIQLALFASLILALGCTDRQDSQSVTDASHEQLNYGSERCDFSGEVIETVRYGGRLELENGEIYNFMSVECLAGFYLKLEDRSKVKSIKAVDFSHGKQLLETDELVFLYSKLRPSPNGMFLTAVDASDQKMKTFIYDAYPGPYLEWDEVLELVQKEWDLTEIASVDF